MNDLRILHYFCIALLGIVGSVPGAGLCGTSKKKSMKQVLFLPTGQLNEGLA